jgi:hypothetical protein
VTPLFLTECAEEDDATEAAEGIYALRELCGFIFLGALCEK